jgi:hypothetical protein
LRRTPAPISERGSGSGLFRIQQAGASAFRSTPSLQFNSRQSRDSASPRFFTKLGCAVNSLRLANDIQQQQIIPQDTSRFVYPSANGLKTVLFLYTSTTVAATFHCGFRTFNEIFFLFAVTLGRLLLLPAQ